MVPSSHVRTVQTATSRTLFCAYAYRTRKRSNLRLRLSSVRLQYFCKRKNMPNAYSVRDPEKHFLRVRLQRLRVRLQDSRLRLQDLRVRLQDFCLRLQHLRLQHLRLQYLRLQNFLHIRLSHAIP